MASSVIAAVLSLQLRRNNIGLYRYAASCIGLGEMFLLILVTVFMGDHKFI